MPTLELGGKAGAGMKIIAFDLGSTWAMAWNFSEPNPQAAHCTLTGKRPEKLGDFMLMLRDSEPAYQAWSALSMADVVVFERPFARGQAATRMLWGMAGILEAAAHNAGSAILDITPGEIKKWACGYGNADKPEMILAAKRLGYQGDNEHEADAWCLLKMAEATLTKEIA